MSSRTIEVILLTTTRSIGTVEIDEADYLDWLDGAEDTPDAIREYLEASSDPWETRNSVYDEAERTGRHEVWDSDIDEVRAPGGDL